jgi:hypothetical protein
MLAFISFGFGVKERKDSDSGLHGSIRCRLNILFLVVPVGDKSKAALVEAPDPRGMVPTSTKTLPHICKVYDNLHMQWMGIWIRHHAVTTTYMSSDLGNRPQSWVTAEHRRKSLCIG